MVSEICAEGTVTIEISALTLSLSHTTAKVNEIVTATGKTPKPNQVVWLEQDFLIDIKIVETTSDSDSNYSMTFSRDAIGTVKIHAEVDVPWLPNIVSPSIAITFTNGIPPVEKLTLKTPTFAFTNEPIKLTGTTEGINQQVLIMLEKGVWGIDWAARDETLKSVTSDGEGNFETEIIFENVGMPKVYAAQKKEWWSFDILAKDIKSQTHSILVIDWWILAAIGVLLVYVLYQRGFFKKIVKKRRKK